MKIIARKCNYTGRIFTNMANYAQHMAEFRANNHRRYKFNFYRDGRAAVFAKMAATVYSIDELATFITDNWMYFYVNGLLNNWKYRSLVTSRATAEYPLLKSLVTVEIHEVVTQTYDDGSFVIASIGLNIVTDQNKDLLETVFINTPIEVLNYRHPWKQGRVSNGLSIQLNLDNWPGLAETTVMEILSRE